jgi:Sigma-70 factor, region 1.1
MTRREFITPIESAASKANATKQKEEVPNNDGPETPPDSPPIDLWDDTVKKLIHGAKKRGYVTRDQINASLPSEEVKSEQIEDILVMFNETGGQRHRKEGNRDRGHAGGRGRATRRGRKRRRAYGSAALDSVGDQEIRARRAH